MITLLRIQCNNCRYIPSEQKIEEEMEVEEDCGFGGEIVGLL